jgi:hypothetical protein
MLALNPGPRHDVADPAQADFLVAVERPLLQTGVPIGEQLRFFFAA